MVAHAVSREVSNPLATSVHLTVVVIPVFNGYDSFKLCFEALLRNTDLNIPILIVDDAGDDRRFLSLVQNATTFDRPITILHRERNGGFVSACNDAFESTGTSDVVILNSDCVVGPEWLPRLREAAYSSTTIATATTLTNNGTILSVPKRNSPFEWREFGIDIDELAKRVSDNSLYLRPTIPTAVGHCFYIKRKVINLIGGFDPIFGRGYGEEVDFSLRATLRGFHHVCADDVFTIHHGGASFGSEKVELSKQGHSVITERYPWYEKSVDAIANSSTSSLAFALERARIALLGPKIGIDARKLGVTLTGTNRVILGSITGLAEALFPNPLTVFTSPNLEDYFHSFLRDLPNVIPVDDTSVSSAKQPIVDVVYRPCQIDNQQDLAWLRRAGGRIVINQLDLIAWRNPSYFESAEEWMSMRDLTRATLKVATGVTTISEHVLEELQKEQLISSDTVTSVVKCGLDHDYQDETLGCRPESVSLPFVLAIGANYNHKNRDFSLRVFASMIDQGWDGSIVLCGPTPPFGDSTDVENGYLKVLPNIHQRVIRLGIVSEEERRWLLQNASLVLYPSASEGFGLVPFEAAGYGTPVLTTRSGGLDEILPLEIQDLDDFDPERAAKVAMELMNDQSMARAQIESISSAASEYRWSGVGAEIRNVIFETLNKPASNIAAVLGEDERIFLIPNGESLHFGVDSNANRLELLFSIGQQTRWIKRVISPNGSRRQRIIRSLIHSYRRNRLSRSDF